MTKVTAYKAFNADWTCLDFKYEVGKTYEHDGEVEKCASGFHACAFPFDCLTYYPPTGKFAEVALSGDMQHDSDKTVAAKIEIVAELSLPQFIQRAVDAIIAKATSTETNTGYQSAATNTGNQSAAKVEGANAHALADYEKRILSALEARPIAEVQAEARKEALEEALKLVALKARDLSQDARNQKSERVCVDLVKDLEALIDQQEV